MRRKLLFQPEAERQLATIMENRADPGLRKQVLKTLALLETDLRHPSLRAHQFRSLTGAHGEDIYEAYAQNNTPGAYRIFFHYGPDEMVNKKRIPVLTVIAITAHP